MTAEIFGTIWCLISPNVAQVQYSTNCNSSKTSAQKYSVFSAILNQIGTISAKLMVTAVTTSRITANKRISASRLKYLLLRESEVYWSLR